MGRKVFVPNCQRKEITLSGGIQITDKAWKRFERRVASKVGGERIPINGRKGVDIKHPYLDIECKYRKNLPAWLFEDAWRQANEGTGIPAVVVGKHNSERMFAVVNLDDLVQLLIIAVEHIGEKNETYDVEE